MVLSWAYWYCVMHGVDSQPKGLTVHYFKSNSFGLFLLCKEGGTGAKQHQQLLLHIVSKTEISKCWCCCKTAQFGLEMQLQKWQRQHHQHHKITKKTTVLHTSYFYRSIHKRNKMHLIYPIFDKSSSTISKVVLTLSGDFYEKNFCPVNQNQNLDDGDWYHLACSLIKRGCYIQ